MTLRRLLLLAAAACFVVTALPAPPHAFLGYAAGRAAEAPAPVFAHITWEHRPEDLGERVRLHDPDRPLLTGYRSLQGLPHVDGVSLQDVTYWFYEGRLARLHAIAAADDEDARDALLEHLSSLHGHPFHEALEGPALRWVSGDARVTFHDPGSGRIHVTIEHGEVIAGAEAAAEAVEPGVRFAQWLQDLERHAASIGYRDLLRSPRAHEGRAVRYRGRIIQVADARRWRIGVVDQGTIGAGNVVYVIYEGPDDPAVAPDTAVEFIGIARGLYTYRSALGTEVTVPEIHAYRVAPLP